MGISGDLGNCWKVSQARFAKEPTVLARDDLLHASISVRLTVMLYHTLHVDHLKIRAW